MIARVCRRIGGRGRIKKYLSFVSIFEITVWFIDLKDNNYVL
jgi:hypothetical protein